MNNHRTSHVRFFQLRVFGYANVVSNGLEWSRMVSNGLEWSRMVSNGLESHRHVAGNLVKPLCIGENSPVRVGPGPVYRWASKQTRTCRKNVFQKCWSGMPYRSDIVYLWACLSPVHHFLWLLPYFIEVRGCHLAFRLFRMKMWDCMIQTTSLHYINALLS